TGIGLPGEAAGLLREASTWSDVSLATISYGHGVAVTTLQLAAAYRTLAADGMYRAPRLVRGLSDAEREVPQEERRVWSPETAGRVRKRLEAAVGPKARVSWPRCQAIRWRGR